jgi:hypothetical protein
MKSPRIHLAVLAAAVVVLVPGTAVAGYASFEDGPFGVHEDGIEWLASTGVTAGCTPSEYCPDDGVSRAQMATFLHRLSGRAPGTDPSVDARTVEGRSAADLEVVNGFAEVTEQARVTDAVVDLEVACPPGTRVLGGGGMIDGLFAQYMGGPTADGRGWFVVWVSDDYRTREVEVRVTATCAPVDAGAAAASTTTDEDRAGAVATLRREVEERRAG